MTLGFRLSIASLLLGLVTLVVVTVVLPPRVRFGSLSIPCDTVVFPQRNDPIVNPLCARAGAYRLRATVAIGALLAALSIGPILIERNGLSSRVWVTWGAAYVAVMLGAITLLAMVGARHTTVFFDL